MILTTGKLNKLLNSEYIKNIYPMIDHVKTNVVWDGDEKFPTYDIDLEIYVNDPDMTTFNMYDKGLDPRYFVDFQMIYILKFMGSGMREMGRVLVSVFGPEGNMIYGNF